MAFFSRSSLLTGLLARDVEASGFALASAEEVRLRIDHSAGTADWDLFVESWNDLTPDAYMKDGGHYRGRRFGTYRANPDGIFSKGPQPHFQATRFNGLNGGIDRWFAPIDSQIARCRTLMAVMTMAQAVFERCSGHRDWHVEVHQFRIRASRRQSGRPTPEGMHRDGVDFGLVMMIEAKNAAGGKTMIENADGQAQHEITLKRAGECLLFDDLRVRHGVSAISQVDPSEAAVRNVLVITFKATDCRRQRGEVKRGQLEQQEA
jgi:hypothetical protein